MRILRSFTLLALASAAFSAHAALTVYTDRGAFEAATAGGISKTETFSTDRNLVANDNLYNGVDYRLQIAGASDGNFGISGGLLRSAEYAYPSLGIGSSSIDFVFGAPVFAFGADFFSAFSSTNSIAFSIDGQTVSLGAYLAKPGTGFFGIVSTTAFSVVDVIHPLSGSGSSYSETYTLDNLTYVSAAPNAPAPAAAMAFGLGFLRRRIRAQA